MSRAVCSKILKTVHIIQSLGINLEFCLKNSSWSCFITKCTPDSSEGSDFYKPFVEKFVSLCGAKSSLMMMSRASLIARGANERERPSVMSSPKKRFIWSWQRDAGFVVHLLEEIHHGKEKKAWNLGMPWFSFSVLIRDGMWISVLWGTFFVHLVSVLESVFFFSFYYPHGSFREIWFLMFGRFSLPWRGEKN